MRRRSLVRDVRIRVDGRRLRVVSMATREGVETVTVADDLHVMETFGKDALLDMYARGEMTFEDADDDGSLPEDKVARRRRADEASYHTLKQHERAQIDSRKFLVEYVGRELRGRAAGQVDEDEMQRILNEAAAAARKTFGLDGFKASRSTYYRWLAALNERGSRMDLRSEERRRGRKEQIASEVRSSMVEKFGDVFRDARLQGKIQTHPVEVVMTAVAEALPKAVLPHASTFYRHYKRYPAYDRDLVERGKQWVRNAYRQSGKSAEPEHALDVVQFDETRLPLFVVHDILGVPLGRPWLAFIIDVFASAPLGYALSFTPPSDELSAAAFRHAVMPKAYMAAQYDGLRWRYAGLPRFVVADNGLTQHGFTLDAICANLDVEWEFCPRRTPWAKATVEGFFGRLNESLLKELPGFCLPLDSGVSSSDYDPTKNAVVTMSQLDRVLHYFFLGKLYAHKTIKTLAATPDQLWSMGTQSAASEFPAASRDVDLLFCIRRSGSRLDHNGVRYEGLDYWSDDLGDIRRMRGAESKCDIALDPNTMAHIYVHERDDVWRKAYCVEPEYGRSVTLYQHKLVRKYALSLGGRDDLRSRLEAKVDLSRQVAEVLTGGHGIRLATAAARFLNVGVDRLAAPVSDRVDRLAPSRPVLAAIAPPPPREPAPDAAEAVAATGDERKPVIPVFKTNQLLRGGRHG